MDRFGVPQLDRLLETIPDHSTLILVNDPGIEAEPFLYQATGSHLAEGREVVYVVLSRSPSSVRRSLGEYGFDAGAGLHFIDGFSALMGAQDDASYRLDEPGNVDALIDLIEQAAVDHPDALLLIDPLSTLIDQAGFDVLAERFPRLQAAMKRFMLSAALFTRWPYAEDVDSLLSQFDATIKLRGVEDRILVSQYFAVERARWVEEVSTRPVLYKALKPGGVFAYIPKIVVTGPFHAGKTTFVQTLSDSSVSVNRLGTTIALDHGHVTIDGLTADVFGTPGQERFDPILKIISGQALGVIVVVDSTRPDTFPRAREMMRQTWKQGLPIIIAANKQDVAGALSLAEVKRQLDTPSQVRVVPCTATIKSSCASVLRELIQQIMGQEAAA